MLKGVVLGNSEGMEITMSILGIVADCSIGNAERFHSRMATVLGA